MSARLGNLRYAVRVLSKSPTFTLTAVVCLGLGIGANTALFCIFNTLLWKPIPAAEPQALVRIFAKGPGAGRLYQNFSHPEYLDYGAEKQVLAGLLATTGVEVGFRAGGGDAIRAFGEAVTDGYFQVLGVRPALGRLLTPSTSGGESAATEVVLSHRFWERRLQSDPDVVGKTVWLTGVPFSVAGVAPRGFNGTYPSPIFAPELWLPLAAAGRVGNGNRPLDDRGDRSLGMLGRLKPGVGLAQAQAALSTVAARLERSYPGSNKGVKALVFRELDTHPEVYSSRALNLVAVLFLGLAALVLVVACANLANLMLARGASRRKEIAMRLALGAGRWHLVRQLMTEAMLLALLAGAVGLLAGHVATRAVSSVRLPMDVPLAFDVTLDLRALWFTLAVSLASGLVFGLLPALGTSRPDLVPALKGGESGGRRRRRFGLANLLVVTQVAVSLVLVAAAGLFWRSIAAVATIDPGMQLAGRTLVSFSPSLLRYDPSRTAGFYRALLARVSEAPEVQDAALVGWVPLGFSFDEGSFIVEGAEARHGEEDRRSLVNVVTPAFFETAGVELRRGRPFTDRDTEATLPVAIVNETFAAREWPGRDAIGQRLRPNVEGASWLTVVGVVADGKYRTLTEPAQSYVLRPLSQRPTGRLTLVVKSGHGHAAALTAIRRSVRAIDPSMPLLDVKTMEQQLAKVRFLPQAMTALAGPASAAAMLIAAIGVYGVVAYSVGRRTREFGIRLAIGAPTRAVIGQVMAQGLTVVGVGLALGAAGALALGRVMRRLLVGVSASDPLVLGGAILLLLAVASVAVYLPARHASRVDPLIALRQE